MNLFAILAHFSKSLNLRQFGTVAFKPPFTLYNRNHSSLKPIQLQPKFPSTEKMSDTSSEEFYDLTFTFSVEDLTRIDASVEASFQQLDQRVGDASFPTGIGGLNTASSPEEEELIELDPIPSQTSTVPADNVDEPTANSSSASDTFELNIGTLSAEDLELIDTATSGNRQSTTGKESPAIEIELEDVSSGSGSDLLQNKSPLEQFRSYKPLSVTDLCGPSWCEVQYDYGLRGKRSRPLSRRPKSFLSSSGKTISPAVRVAQKNDVTTKQGKAIHKELEQEIKFEELKVDITTDETRWALRLVNMIACLRDIMTGFTREMPVFGIVHDEVVVGIMDEVVKFEIPSLSNRNPKRPLNPSQSASQAKRAKKDRDRRFQSIDRFFQSPKKADALIPDDPASVASTAPRTAHTLYIKDSKTRKRDYLPKDDDTYSGRIQLMIYRRLLSELVSTNPPYDFKRLWDKLGVDSTEVFPTQFLVQARLIEESEQFKTACLDDLVESWNKLVKEFNIVDVDPCLELIYRLQPPRSEKGKEKRQQSDEFSVEDEGLAKALAASLRDVQGGEQIPVVGPSNLKEVMAAAAEEVVETIQDQEDTTTAKNSSDEMSDSEDVQLQWAIQQSILPQADNPDTSNLPGGPSVDSVLPVTTGKGKAKGDKKKETGIRCFKIIGTKSFLHNDLELDNYLTQVLHWWRGERRPEGVSLEHSYRCKTCEYAEDCEWRAEKALEFSSRRKT